jgi:hypothetical protein
MEAAWFPDIYVVSGSTAAFPEGGVTHFLGLANAGQLDIPGGQRMAQGCHDTLFVATSDGVTALLGSGHPSVATNFPVGGARGISAFCVEHRWDNYVFVTATDGLHLLDLLSELQTLDTGESRDVTALGSYAYVATVNSGLVVVSLGCEE